MSNAAKILRSLHQQSMPLLLANAWDAGSARLIEDLGAKAVATTSAGVAWALGYPDGGKMPASEHAWVAKNITRVVKVPVSIDFENGYSTDPKVVAENIKPLLDAGVAGINIEDGPDAPEVLAAKIAAIRKAVEAAGTDLFINVRTDVYLANLVPDDQKIDEVARRSKLYANAGGDGLFIPFLTAENEIAEIVSMTTLPLNVMSLSSLPVTSKLGELGVKRLSAGSGIPQIIYQNIADLAGKFLVDGNPQALATGYMAHAQLQELFK